MDIIDIKIINALINNSRCNASEISDVVGLSVSAVIERIKKLETAGIIKKYTVILDNAVLGKDVSALIMVSLDHPKYNESFVKAMIDNESISECHYLAGDFDYQLKIATYNTKRLERLLNDIKGITGVSKTKTMVILSTLKNEYSNLIKKHNK